MIVTNPVCPGNCFFLQAGLTMTAVHKNLATKSILYVSPMSTHSKLGTTETG